MDEHSKPTCYVIRVEGFLSDRLLSAFPELQASNDDGETVLSGVLPDQSALHGVLTLIEALGLELLEVRRMPTRTKTSAERSEGDPWKG